MSDDATNKTNPGEESKQESSSGQEHISVKKSTFNKLIIGIVLSLVAVAFFSGYTLGSQNVHPLVIQENPQSKNPPPQPTQVPPTESRRIFVSLSDDPVKGNPKAQVTIVEFSDFQCPFCARFFTQTLPQIQRDYIDSGKVKLVFRDFPLDSIHPNAVMASIAAHCANEQAKFWEYHDKLFEGQTQWASLGASGAEDTFINYASELGLNSDNFNSCLNSSRSLDEISSDYKDGVNYGVTGTPAFFIGNEKDGYITLIGAKPYSEFQKTIENELS